MLSFVGNPGLSRGDCFKDYHFTRRVRVILQELRNRECSTKPKLVADCHFIFTILIDEKLIKNIKENKNTISHYNITFISIISRDKEKDLEN